MNKVPFGLHSDGTWRNAYDVPRGLECRCVCPVCGSGLVAKQGKSVVWHFAHVAESFGNGKGGPLIIEINVSNPKDDEYIHDLSGAELSAVEITLSAEDVFTEIGKGKGDRLSALKRLVLGPRSANRRWLNFAPGLLGKSQMRRAE